MAATTLILEILHMVIALLCHAHQEHNHVYMYMYMHMRMHSLRTHTTDRALAPKKCACEPSQVLPCCLAHG